MQHTFTKDGFTYHVFDNCYTTKVKYDENGRVVSYLNSNGSFYTREFDKDGNDINFRCLYHDNEQIKTNKQQTMKHTITLTQEEYDELAKFKDAAMKDEVVFSYAPSSILDPKRYVTNVYSKEQAILNLQELNEEMAKNVDELKASLYSANEKIRQIERKEIPFWKRMF